MGDLDGLIDKLNNDQYSAVSVIDLDTNSFLCRNKTHAQIKEEFGSGEEFFESLFANGHKRLNLSLKRKNGSTFKLDGLPFDVNFSKATQEQPVIKLPAQTIQSERSVQAEPMFQNSFGLGQLDMINLFVAKNDVQRLQTENQYLIADNKEKSKKIEEQKEEILGFKYNREGSNNTQEMIMGAIKNMPMIMASVKGTPLPAVGLASPAELFSSPVKQAFADELQNIDDSTVTVLQSINNGLDNSIDFQNELATLLQKYQLWQA